jgi:hypothetical protein
VYKLVQGTCSIAPWKVSPDSFPFIPYRLGRTMPSIAVTYNCWSPLITPLVAAADGWWSPGRLTSTHQMVVNTIFTLACPKIMLAFIITNTFDCRKLWLLVNPISIHSFVASYGCKVAFSARCIAASYGWLSPRPAPLIFNDICSRGVTTSDRRSPLTIPLQWQIMAAGRTTSCATRCSKWSHYYQHTTDLQDVKACRSPLP